MLQRSHVARNALEPFQVDWVDHSSVVTRVFWEVFRGKVYRADLGARKHRHRLFKLDKSA